MSKKTLPDELQGLIRATPGLARLARAARAQGAAPAQDPKLLQESHREPASI